jgi:hypothetical protein
MENPQGRCWVWIGNVEIDEKHPGALRVEEGFKVGRSSVDLFVHP